jgi:ribosome-associated protein
VVQRPRRATGPTPASRRKRLDAKRRRGDVKRARRRPDEDG